MTPPKPLPLPRSQCDDCELVVRLSNAIDELKTAQDEQRKDIRKTREVAETAAENAAKAAEGVAYVKGAMDQLVRQEEARVKVEQARLSAEGEAEQALAKAKANRIKALTPFWQKVLVAIASVLIPALAVWIGYQAHSAQAPVQAPTQESATTQTSQVKGQ